MSPPVPARPHKALFADIDGTLAPFERRHLRLLDRGCLGRLNRILDLTGAALVICSAWGYRESREDLERWLRTNGCAYPVHSVTPRRSRDLDGAAERASEVYGWLRANPVMAYVILDDDWSWSRPFPELARVHVLPSPDIGIRDVHVQIAVGHLGAVELTMAQERQVRGLRARPNGSYSPGLTRTQTAYRRLAETGLVAESVGARCPTFTLTTAGWRWEETSRIGQGHGMGKAVSA